MLKMMKFDEKYARCNGIAVFCGVPGVLQLNICYSAFFFFRKNKTKHVVVISYYYVYDVTKLLP